MNITILLSSVRDGRLADTVLQKVISLIGDKFPVTIVDPKEYVLPLLNLRFYEMKEPEDVFVRLHNIFMKTDGFIIVTAEYNHGIPPALKNMLDHYGAEFTKKACGIVSYSNGAIGGARSAEQLRLVCATLGMPAIPTSPSWGLAHKAGKPEGKSFEDNFERTFSFFLPEFLWYTEAFMKQRAVVAEK
jgi:NAD(P)H-dependent FMN reductase